MSDAETLNNGEIAIVAIRIAMYIIGTLGNALVIFIILFLKDYKKITHWYVLQLALADLLFLQTLPAMIHERIGGTSFQSEGFCKFRQALFFINYYSSILFLTVMAIDRYLAVCHALSVRIQRWRSHQSVVMITIAVWIIAIALSTPLIRYSGMRGIQPSCTCDIHFPTSCEGDGDNGQCENVPTGECSKPTNFNGPHFSDIGSPFSLIEYNETGSGSGSGSGSGNGSNGPEYYGYNTFNDTADSSPSHICVYSQMEMGWHYYVYANFTVMFLFPLLVITACYVLIVAKLAATNVTGTQNGRSDNTTAGKQRRGFLWRLTKRPPSASGTGKSFKEKRRVSVMCATLVVLFLVCWLPFHAYHLAKIVGMDQDICEILPKVVSIFAFMNSTLNPYFYNFLGTFRKRMRQVTSHNRMRALLSMTGLTKITGRSSSANTSSEGRGKKSSLPMDGSTATGQHGERYSLQTFHHVEKNGTSV